MESYQKIMLGYSIIINICIGLEGIFSYNPLKILLRSNPVLLSVCYALAGLCAIGNILLYEKS